VPQRTHDTVTRNRWPTDRRGRQRLRFGQASRQDSGTQTGFGTRDRHGARTKDQGDPARGGWGHDTLMGKDVDIRDDARLGDIQALKIDMSSGGIGAAGLSHAGVIGRGEKLRPAPPPRHHRPRAPSP